MKWTRIGWHFAAAAALDQTVKPLLILKIEIVPLSLGWVGGVGRLGGWVTCVGLAASAPEGREGRSPGPKGPQLEVGARRVPRLLVLK